MNGQMQVIRFLIAHIMMAILTHPLWAHILKETAITEPQICQGMSGNLVQKTPWCMEGLGFQGIATPPKTGGVRADNVVSTFSDTDTNTIMGFRCAYD